MTERKRRTVADLRPSELIVRVVKHLDVAAEALAEIERRGCKDAATQLAGPLCDRLADLRRRGEEYRAARKEAIDALLAVIGGSSIVGSPEWRIAAKIREVIR